MKIPANNQWTQTNSGDIFGILHDTQNVTFDSEGKLRLSRKPFCRYTSSDDANLNYVLSIVFYDDQYLALTNDSIFQFDFGGSTTTEITSGTPALNSDMAVCFNRAYFTENSNLAYFDGASVTGSLFALTADVPHPLCVFDSFTDYKLAVGNDNEVSLLNSSHAEYSNVLTLPPQYQVTTLGYRNGYLYVGTKHQNGGEAKIFIWDGTSANANFEVPTGGYWVYSIIPYQNSVAYVTNQGQLCVINGSTPVQLAAFPVYYKPDAIWDDGSNVTYLGKILHRGMCAVGELIYLNVDGSVDSGFIPEMKTGLWVFDPSIGLYHRTAHSIDTRVVETPSNLSSNTLTLSTHNLKTGDCLHFRAVGSLTGVATGTRYFVSAESSTTVKLAASRKSLKAGRYITIGGSIGAASVAYVPNTDVFGGWGGRAGAICPINAEEPIHPGWDSPVVWGARMEDYNQAAFYGLMSFTEGWTVGRFTTQRIYSSQIEEVWKQLTVFLDGIHLSNEKILIKYKIGDGEGYPTDEMEGVWASGTTINSIAGTIDEDPWGDIEVGDEINIINGIGRGYTVHVTAISESSGTYTVTVDESLGTLNEPVYFYADKFKKVGEYTNTRTFKDKVQASLNTQSSWVQIKVELRGFESEVAWLDLSQNTAKVGV